MAEGQSQLEFANAKAIEANTRAIQQAVDKIDNVLDGITINLNDDISMKIATIATALARMGATIVPPVDDSDE